jgi:sugar diacid utilization regulator
MAALDWTKIYKKYKGLWIALDEKERKVVAFDKDAKKAYKKARKKGIEVPILFRVPSKIIPYVGTPFWI